MSDLENGSIMSTLMRIVRNLDSRAPTMVKTENGITSGNFYFGEFFHGKFAFTPGSSKEATDGDKLIEGKKAIEDNKSD
ncbi:hypothetical protein JCM33374_g4629 [Metschnikowia sp. JCM 33374]|nr:hypothetical protein JCM33374_g4629 [Metschnikowia sp. JCM 33374]